MNFKERIKHDIKTYKSLGKKERREFIWDYYKVPIIAVVCVVFLAVVSILTAVNQADTVMYAVFINADDTGDGDMIDGIMERSGTDMTGKTVDISASYTLRYDDNSNSYSNTVELLAALFGIGDLDLFASDEAVFSSYADKEAFVDLSLFIESDVLSDHDLYTYTSSEGREVVAGIWLHDGSPLHEAGFYTDDVLIGVAANAQNLDEAVAFMKQLLTEY
jgi:hypothetical protein